MINSKRKSGADRIKTKTRLKIRRLNKYRLTVTKSLKNIYAQVFTADGGKVIAQASTLDKELKGKDFGEGSIKIAEAVGKLVAERAAKQGIKDVAFDRSGNKYHGRIKALADGARAGGLEF